MYVSNLKFVNLGNPNVNFIASSNLHENCKFLLLQVCLELEYSEYNNYYGKYCQSLS